MTGHRPPGPAAAPDSSFDQALRHHRAGQLAEAERLYRLVLAAAPDHAASHNLLGVIAAQTGHPDQAIERISRAIEIEDGVSAFHNNLGEVLRRAGRMDEAAGCFRRALALAADNADALNNLGITCHALGRLDEAEAHYRRALSIRPDYPDALSNLGAACQERNDLDGAEHSYRQALAFGSGDAGTYANLATVLLARGDFDEGWRLYEWRERGSRPMVAPRHREAPRWAGEDLAGRTLLLHAEQGLGDTLQFARYATAIAAQGVRVLFEVQPPLQRLLSTVPGVARTITMGERPPHFDRHLPLMSAPHRLGTRLDTIPAPIPYLHPDAAETAAWGRRLAGLSGLRVGLVWAGDPRPHDPRVHAIDGRRSMPLAALVPLLSVPGASFVSLQKGAAAAQLADLPPALRPLDRMDDVTDFADTAALVANLDLVISVDTAVAHLAGAMGKAVWIASRFDGCWRWLENRDDSPWYPTARLFRQSTPGDWPEVVGRMADRLRRVIEDGGVPGAITEHNDRSGGGAFSPRPRAGEGMGVREAKTGGARTVVQSLVAPLPHPPAPSPASGRGGARSPDALHRRGLALARQDRPEEAIAALRAAVVAGGDAVALHYDLGAVLQAHGRPAEAEQAYRCALAWRPDDPVILNNLGNALREQGRRDEAIAALRAALRQAPDYAEAHYNLGVLWHKEGRPAEAAAAYRAAVTAKPDFAEALGNLGAALQELNHFNEAERAHRAALRIRPQAPGFHLNLGVTLQQAGRTDEAVAAFRQALRLDPDYPQGHVNLAHALLLRGDFAEGWQEYEWRWRGGVEGLTPPPFIPPPWRGEPLGGRTILLYAEQGLGDTLQFVRYAGPIASLGARVILEVQPPLKRLMATLPGVAEVVAKGDQLPPFDLHLPLMSAPRLIGTRPANIPYLSADAASVDEWGRRLAGLPGPRVGLVWAGNPRSHDHRLQAADRRRSVELPMLAPVLETPGVSFVSLQKDAAAAQLAALAPSMRPYDPMQDVVDFADTAALVANLDLVISVDTSVAHLAGALGKPVWILSRFDGCWRWLEGRDDSPWYPTARLFRQTTAGDWTETVARLTAELRAWVAGDRTGKR